MKILFFISFIYLSGITFSQTTFIVTKQDGTSAESTLVYNMGSFVGKTNEEGEITLDNLATGDVLEFILNLEQKTYLFPENNNAEIHQIVLNLDKNDQVIKIVNIPKIDCPKPFAAQTDPQFIYTTVDEDAEFPGGKKALLSFLVKNLEYPEVCIFGKIYLKFTVLKDGTIENITVLRGVPDCPECEKEAIRVISIMPTWIPAKVSGKSVNSYFYLPININLK